jgi:hypothetical protein
LLLYQGILSRYWFVLRVLPPNYLSRWRNIERREAEFNISFTKTNNLVVRHEKLTNICIVIYSPLIMKKKTFLFVDLIFSDNVRHFAFYFSLSWFNIHNFLYSRYFYYTINSTFMSSSLKVANRSVATFSWVKTVKPSVTFHHTNWNNRKQTDHVTIYRLVPDPRQTT